MAYDKLKESMKKYPWYVEPKPPSEMTDEEIARLRFCFVSEEEGAAILAEIERREKLEREVSN